MEREKMEMDGEKLSRTLYFFTSPTKLEIMRLLFEHEEGLSRKELHRLIDRHYDVIDHAVIFLKRIGVITRDKKLRRYILTRNGRKIFFAIKYIEECVYDAKNKKSKIR